MKTRKAVVLNKAGIHCRPSSRIIQKACEYPETKFRVVSMRGGESDLGSILSLISLGLCKGDEVSITAEGKDAERACDDLAELFECEFDFPPR